MMTWAPLGHNDSCRSACRVTGGVVLVRDLLGACCVSVVTLRRLRIAWLRACVVVSKGARS